MMRKWFAANGIAWLLGAMLCIAAPSAFAQDQQDQAPKKTPYTLAEYNAYQAAQGQTDPNAKIQGLDDFSNKFPNSSLMPLVYQLYYQTYVQLKNYPKVIEYADKYLAVPDDKILIIPGTSKEKLAGDKLQALYFRAVAFNQSGEHDG
jgi:predicted negative regulator of RcsB-dependent stress response